MAARLAGCKSCLDPLPLHTQQAVAAPLRCLWPKDSPQVLFLVLLEPARVFAFFLGGICFFPGVTALPQNAVGSQPFPFS